jgi:signal transduction histidine kinase
MSAMRLSKRVVVVSIASVFAGIVAAYVGSVVAGREVFQRNTIPVSLYLWNRYEHARCLASPETWSLSVTPGTSGFAYDPATLASRNPAAPPLDRALLETIAPSADPPLAIHLPPVLRGGAAIYRSPTDDPCAIVQVRWTARMSKLDALLLFLTITAVASAVGASLATTAVARPLTKLLRHLDDVTHDLRTPIASLQIALEQASDAAKDDASRELLHGALKDVVYLGGLTANLRLASQLREGWDPRRRDARVDLVGAVERVASRARIVARRGGIALDVAVPDGAVLVRCDPVAAEQAIGNVVDNAVAYGDAGGHVAIVLERVGEGFELRVEDDGPGVAPSELPRLGERTFRSDEARARDPRGSGLGLAITREVCDRCRWRLAFESVTPKGLRVTMRGARDP